ncbi:tetratricopeptide repeat protein [Pseudothermotoga sp.]|uniref:tetratricopeptide repeat protein n=1 Tax=Pseudothermotoga sp. TaxID=2033661 RepID=UPI0026B241ED
MNLERFLLILLTVFALLFLLSFQAFVSVRSQLKRSEKMLEAYRMYVSEDYENFERYVEKNDLKELKNLKDSLKRRLFEKYYTSGVTKLNAGDFSSAYEDFKKALQQLPQQDERRAEVVYLMGQSLVKAGRLVEAKTQLSTVINMPNSFYRNQAVKLLIDLYRQTGEDAKAEELRKIYEGVVEQ